MLSKWKDKFVEDCRQWYKLWSSWLAIFWAFIVGILWNYPETLQEIVNTLPEQYRAPLSPLVMLIVGGLPILIRMLKQQKLIDQLKAVSKEKE
jgi:hypothetical protein